MLFIGENLLLEFGCNLKQNITVNNNENQERGKETYPVLLVIEVLKPLETKCFHSSETCVK
jgi:hypothetical protein